MFGTLRYLPEKKVGEFLERESGVAEDGATNKPQHSACDNCRIKKIRCSGRKAGCSRCKTLSLPCNYTHALTRKRKRKQPYGPSGKENENETGLDVGAVATRSPANGAATTAAEQPSLLTMEPHTVDETHHAQDDSNLTFDPIFKEVQTWSNCLDWTLEEGDTFVPELDYPMVCNPTVPVDYFHSGYPGSENMAQQPPPPLASNGSTPPNVLPTPPVDQVLDPTVRITRSTDNITEGIMEGQSSCSCLNSAVFLLDELESPDHEGDPGEQGLDSILSIYQEVLFLCKRMINCDPCQEKSENMMVLSMVLERLTIICGEMIDDFIARMEANGREQASMLAATMDKQPLSLGDYEIEGGDYEIMMGVLVTRRLLELQSFLVRLKTIGSLTRRAHQQARMARIDQHIQDLFRKLTFVCPLVTEIAGRSEKE
ncbi:unnamed protein product [Penicillium pancosmium]